ncbi:MAG: acyltransferase, partial [Pseudomonadota bacterium]
FTAKMVAKSGATVVPVFFDGHNSRLFQVASHLHYTLRMAFLIREFKARVDEPVKVVIGKPLPQAELDARAKDSRAIMEYLRQATYNLSPKPLKSLDPGFEFEDRYR